MPASGGDHPRDARLCAPGRRGVRGPSRRLAQALAAAHHRVGDDSAVSCESWPGQPPAEDTLERRGEWYHDRDRETDGSARTLLPSSTSTLSALRTPAQPRLSILHFGQVFGAPPLHLLARAHAARKRHMAAIPWWREAKPSPSSPTAGSSRCATMPTSSSTHGGRGGGRPPVRGPARPRRVQTLHTTTAVIVNENEPGLLREMADVLEGLAPPEGLPPRRPRAEAGHAAGRARQWRRALQGHAPFGIADAHHPGAAHPARLLQRIFLVELDGGGRAPSPHRLGTGG